MHISARCIYFSWLDQILAERLQHTPSAVNRNDNLRNKELIVIHWVTMGEIADLNKKRRHATMHGPPKLRC